MDLPTIKITRTKGSGRAKKTFAFSATLIGYLAADRLWNRGAGEMTRPAWIAYIAPRDASRIFTANFRGGRSASIWGGSTVLQMMRSGPYRWHFHHAGETTITLAYIPELFHLEPDSSPPEEIAFVFMPPGWWLDHQEEELADEFGSEAREVARAALWTAFVSRRTTLPIPNDLRFHLALYRAALESAWTAEPASSSFDSPSFHAEGLERVGVEAPSACRVSHEEFTEFLCTHTATYFEEEIARGTHRITTNRRVLPYPSRSITQLVFDFEAA